MRGLRASISTGRCLGFRLSLPLAGRTGPCALAGGSRKLSSRMRNPRAEGDSSSWNVALGAGACLCRPHAAISKDAIDSDLMAPLASQTLAWRKTLRIKSKQRAAPHETPVFWYASCALAARYLGKPAQIF